MSNKHRVVILTWHGIYPVGSGHALRVINIAKMLSTKYEVKIVAINHKKNLLFVERDHRAGSIRIIQKDFSKHYSRIFYAISCLANSYPLFYPKKVRTFLAEVIKGAHIIQVESLRLVMFAKRQKIPFVLDEHNVEWERLVYKSKFPHNLLRRIWENTASRFEREAIKASRLVLATSERDKEMLEEAIKDIDSEKIAVIPNCIDKSEYMILNGEKGIHKGPGHAKPVVLFMGSLDYFPNQDAVTLILDHIAPKAPELNFLIVGRGYDFRQSVKPRNVEFTGYVDDIRQAIADAHVCICPLRYGSGTRLKILEYMIMGKPVVSTAKGAEGLRTLDGFDICIEDDISLFAERINELLRNTDLYRKIQVNGKKLVIERYDWRAYSELITRKFSIIISLAANECN